MRCGTLSRQWQVNEYCWKALDGNGLGLSFLVIASLLDRSDLVIEHALGRLEWPALGVLPPHSLGFDAVHLAGGLAI